MRRRSGTTLGDRFVEFDDDLARRGFLPLPPFWRREGKRFYDHGTAREHVARIGRGGIKSTYGVRCALFETIVCDFAIPKGERHYFAFVSENREEAGQRIRQLQEYLRALSVEFSVAGDVIDLGSSPRGFRVLTCRIGAVSGWRCYGWVADEASKWKGDDLANPSREVIASIKAMTVTHPRARGRVLSSPMSDADYHAELVEQGSNEHQLVSIAATWEANPKISEAATHKLERDPRLWAREYAAIPQSIIGGAFDIDDVSSAFRSFGVAESHAAKVIVMDPSGLTGNDAWTWGVVGWSRIEGVETLLFTDVDGVEGEASKHTNADAVAERIASAGGRRGASRVFCDGFAAVGLDSAFNRRGLGLNYQPLKAYGPRKAEAAQLFRRLLRERRVILPKAHAKMRSELLNYQEKITQSGHTKYEAKGSRHDDFATLCVVACVAELENLLPHTRRFSAKEYEQIMGLGYAPGDVYASFAGRDPSYLPDYSEPAPRRVPAGVGEVWADGDDRLARGISIGTSPFPEFGDGGSEFGDAWKRGRGY